MHRKGNRETRNKRKRKMNKNLKKVKSSILVLLLFKLILFILTRQHYNKKIIKYYKVIFKLNKCDKKTHE